MNKEASGCGREGPIKSSYIGSQEVDRNRDQTINASN